MKIFRLGLISALFLGMSSMASAQTLSTPNAASTLTVNITNLSNNAGVVRIALFNSATAFETATDAANSAIAKAAVPISNDQATWSVPNLPYGTYAIKAFHDQDNSGTLPRNLFGIPTTDYGFSNMSSISGKPTFNEAAFTFDATQNNIVTIKMKQP